jgi:hypothetical protein
MGDTPKRDVTELVDVAARTFWDQSPQKAVSKQEFDHLPPLVKLDLREAMLPIVQAVMEKADGKSIFEIDPTIINDAVPVPDEQCGDYPAPCNCDDPFTHGGHK